MEKLTKYKRLITVAAVLVFALCTFVACGSKDSKKTDLPMRDELCTIEEATDIGIIIDYPTDKEPIVAFISPSGKVYQEESDFYAVEYTKSFDYENGQRVRYWLPESDCEVGTWYIEYDKNGNEEISVFVTKTEF